MFPPIFTWMHGPHTHYSRHLATNWTMCIPLVHRHPVSQTKERNCLKHNAYTMDLIRNHPLSYADSCPQLVLLSTNILFLWLHDDLITNKIACCLVSSLFELLNKVTPFRLRYCSTWLTILLISWQHQIRSHQYFWTFQASNYVVLSSLFTWYLGLLCYDFLAKVLICLNDFFVALMEPPN